MSEWLEILKAEVERTSISATASRIGYSRSAVSLALSEKYPGGTEKIEDATLRTLRDSFRCPFLKEIINDEACADYASRAMPTSNATALRHWQSCKTCDFKSRMIGARDVA